MEDLSIVLLSPVRAVASSGRPVLEAAMHHGDREGRHASHDKAHHHFGIT